MPSTQSVFESHDWLAPRIKEGQVDPRNSLAFRKPSWNSPLTSGNPRGAQESWGLGMAHWFLQLPLGPSSQSPFLHLSLNCHRVSFLPHSSQSCSHISIPVTCPGQPSPSLPGLLLPDFAPHILLPQNQESAAVSLSHISNSITFRKPDTFTKTLLCARCGETGLTHSRPFLVLKTRFHWICPG